MMARYSQYCGGSGTNPSVFASGETVSRVPAATMIKEVSMSGHLCAGFLAHYMSPPWVLRIMLGTLLVVMAVLLFVREPAIDKLPRRNLSKRTLLGTLWEAVSAQSHHPDYPAEIAISSEKKRTPVQHALS